MESLGENGFYQKIIIFLVICTSLLTTLYSESISYLTKIPNFDCRDPGMDKTDFHPCIYTEELCSSSIEMKKNYNTSIHNWAYSFDLFCSRESYTTFISDAFFVGGAIGCIVLAKIPDKFGRKKLFCILLILSCILHINLFLTTGAVHGIIVFTFGGFSSFAYGMTGYIISENLPSSKTGIIMGITNGIYPIFGILMGFFYLFINNWRILYFLTAVIHIFVTFFCLKYFQESPRWLASQGNKDECIEAMREIARLNGTTARFEAFLKNNKNAFDFQRIKKCKEEQGKSYSLIQILSFKSQRNKFLLLSFIWIFSCFCFFGIILNLGKLEGGFLALSIMAFTGEAISEILSGFLSGIFGRLSLMKYGSYLGSFGFLFYIFLPKEVSSICIFVSMAGYAACYNIIFIYTPEVFPTPIRGTCCNILFLLCRFSPLFVPFLTQIFGNSVNFVFIFFGFLVGFFCNFLEESLNMPLPEEIPEEVGVGSGLLSAASGSEKFDIVSSFGSRSFYQLKY